MTWKKILRILRQDPIEPHETEGRFYDALREFNGRLDQVEEDHTIIKAEMKEQSAQLNKLVKNIRNE